MAKLAVALPVPAKLVIKGTCSEVRDIITLTGTYLAVPAGTSCFAAPAIGEIARQISGRDRHAPAPPDALHRPGLPRRP